MTLYNWSLARKRFISTLRMASIPIPPPTTTPHPHSSEQGNPTPTAPPAKLIYAPGSQPSTHQASQFTKAHLSRADLLPTPHAQFAAWFAAARAAGIAQAEACTLATAELPSGRVSARIVYLKELDAEGGFVVYSNWGPPAPSAAAAASSSSRKGKNVA